MLSIKKQLHLHISLNIQQHCCVFINLCLLLQSDTDTDSIGNVVCQQADALAVVAVVIAGHRKSQTGAFFMGSVTSFCTHHCKKPVLIVH